MSSEVRIGIVTSMLHDWWAINCNGSQSVIILAELSQQATADTIHPDSGVSLPTKNDFAGDLYSLSVGRSVFRFTLALPGLHAFTGCDTSSAFLHNGKQWPLTIMKRTVDFIRAFTDLGPMQAGLTIHCCQCCKSLCSLRTRPVCQTQ